MTNSRNKNLWTVFGIAAALAIELWRTSDEIDQLKGQTADQRKHLQTGLIGQLGPTVVESMISDLRTTAASNPTLREILSTHGYSVAPGGDQ